MGSGHPPLYSAARAGASMTAVSKRRPCKPPRAEPRPQPIGVHAYVPSHWQSKFQQKSKSWCGHFEENFTINNAFRLHVLAMTHLLQDTSCSFVMHVSGIHHQ